jgi:putative nucleotidyltransferase with HDIG domain
LRYEFKGIKKDGSIIYLEAVDIVSKRDGNIAGTHSYIWDITERKKLEKEHEYTLAKLQGTLRGIILAMAKFVEERDPFTAGHQQRVSELAGAIAEEMNLTQEKVDGIRLAGAIHDIGKIRVPVEILSKPTKLSENEFEIMKVHTKIGYDILKNIPFPWPIAQIVYQHHERMDGSGYPQGLIGKDIMIEARILAVADVIEAMASHRPFRSTIGIKKAIEEISQNRDRLYDSAAVDACIRLFEEKKI